MPQNDIAATGRIVPTIRFKGFTDDWEQRKLGDVADKKYGGGTPRTSEKTFWNGKIPWFQSADLIEHEVLSAIPRKRITESGLDKSAAQLIPANSIAIVTRVGVGKLAFMPFSYATSQDFLSLSELNVDGKFGCYAIYRVLQKEKSLTQGTSIKGITKDELLRKSLMTPSPTEQKRIGVYFSNLDHLITLHQRKLDQEKKLKEYLLQNMFPREGEDTPRIRFSDFTGPWIQRKLGDIMQESFDKTGDFKANPLYSLTIQDGVTSKTERYERSFLVRKEESIFKIVRPGFFVTNPMNLRFGAVGYNKEPFPVSVSGYYDVFSIDNGACNSFWDSYFKSPYVLKKFNDIATGSLIEKRRVKYSTLSLMSLPTPVSVKERNKISKCLGDIDTRITLNQRKLESLKELKKGFLQKMFI